MPTNRRHRTHHRTVLSLDSFDVRAQWAFTRHWHPPENEAERQQSAWRTWTEFFRDYDAIEDELIERLRAGTAMWSLGQGQRAPFGSTARRANAGVQGGDNR